MSYKSSRRRRRVEERGETGRRGGKGDTEAEIGDGPVYGRGLELVTRQQTELRSKRKLQDLEIKLGGQHSEGEMFLEPN